MSYTLTHLKELEAESIHIIRETFAQFNKPAILFSGGKDSIVLTHLAKKAFWPAKIPFPLVHVDTGHNFLSTKVKTLLRQYFLELIILKACTSLKGMIGVS